MVFWELEPTTWVIIAGSLWLFAFLYSRRWQRMRLITIIDGDTFMAVDVRGKRHKLRLQDVDCPELSQRNGPEARAFVQAKVGKDYVRVQLRGRDRYARHLARIRVGHEDLALALVKAGLAYPLKSGARFQFAALGARIARKGVHRGFGQAKPWNSVSRSSRIGRWLSRRKYNANRRRRSRR
jgi:endonuclease YncB( thermonuclease family)